jgi:hypothetical protein
VRYPLIGMGLCRILDMDFREFHTSKHFGEWGSKAA